MAGEPRDLPPLDGRLLLVFRAVLRTGSATAAAEHLELSQPAVSHALARLRRHLDDPLFVRRPHGLEPTRRTLELAAHVDALIELAAELTDPAPEFDPATTSRRFVVAAPEFVVALVGGALIARWASTAPHIALVTRQQAPTDVVDELRRGEVDVAIGRYGRRAARPRTTLSPFIDDEYCVVARRDHPTVRRSLDLATYLTLGHVVAAGESEGEPGERLPRGLHVAAVVPGWLTALVMVSASDRIATCPRRLAERHAVTLGLRVIDLPGPRHPIEVGLMRRDDADPGVDWLVDELRAAA